MVIAIRRTGASTVVTSTATVNPASLFAWESATVAIIATGTTAVAPIGAEHLKSGTAPIAHAGVVIAIRRTGASTVVTSTATVNPASLFAWESATVAIIATGTTAVAPIGAEHLKSGTAPAFVSIVKLAHRVGSG